MTSCLNQRLDLEMVLKFANDLGGIATGYYDVCKGILSKIHIKYMKLAMELDLKFHLTGVL